jgi:signal transduction histidine kinase
MGSRVLAPLLLVLASASASAQDEPKLVLVLHSMRDSMPVNSEFAAGIREGLDLSPDSPAEIATDTLDLESVHDEEYIRRLIEVNRLRYQNQSPSLVITTYTWATRFLLDHRNQLFPDVPVVFCAAELQSEDLERLPPDVTGVTSKGEFAGTLELMTRLHPDLRQVVLIVGSGDLDAAAEREARKALRPLEGRFELTWLRGLSLPQLTETVSALPPRTAILYLVQFMDSDGGFYVPWKVAEAVSQAASAPVYGLWDTLIGTGVVGGRVIPIEEQGLAAGKIARRILLGEAPADIPVVRMERNDPLLDARQLKRWNIDERLLPEGSRVLYREYSAWEEHRNAILLAASLILLQTLGIATLLRSRQRLQQAQARQRVEADHRAQAEKTARKLERRVAALEKESSLGVLAGDVAHEVSQPLTAIQNYAQAARRYVTADSAKADKLAELLAEMASQAERAGAIIEKTRKLLGSGGLDAVPVELDPVLNEVLALMAPEVDTCGCRIDYRVTAPVPLVLVDALQLQLVIVNLLRNAVEAAAPPAQNGGGVISMTVGETADRMVQVSVADCGPGVPANEVEAIFEPLYTTKEAGLGVGLATCRTIVEAHGGRIWCAANPGGGTTFHFTVPAAEGGV